MSELIFEVTQEQDGGFVAECLTENIFTQADTWEQLRVHVQEATEAFHFDRPMPNGRKADERNALATKISK